MVLPKRAAQIALLAIVPVLAASPARAQRVNSIGLAVGALAQRDADITAAFDASASFEWQLPWLVMLQTAVADIDSGDTGTVRDVSLAILPMWQPAGGRVLLALGGSLHDERREFIGGADQRKARPALTGVAGIRLPFAGRGVAFELLGRADLIESTPQFAGLFGVRVQPGMANSLTRGEPMRTPQAAHRAAVWNEVLMQLVLLQQSLESFTRIRETDTGIELEFDMAALTLYDDIAKAARVLAAADPPVVITVFAPNAGRTGAAVTAGSFPAERLRLQRDNRVFLRVEH